MHQFTEVIAGRRFRRLLAGCAFSLLPLAPILARADAIPVETLFKKPKYGGAALSTSGRYLAVLTPIKERLGVGVIDLDTNELSAIPVTEGDAIRLVWLNDRRMIVVIGDRQRGTGEKPVASGMWAVDRDGKDPVRLYGSLVRGIPDTDDVLMVAWSESRYAPDIVRLNTRSARRETLVFDHPGNISRWVADFDGVPRAAVTQDLDHDKSAWYVRKDGNAPWQKVEEGAYHSLSSYPLAFSPDGKILYVDSRKDRDRYAIYEYAMDTGTISGPVAQHPERDVFGRFVFSPHKLHGLTYADDRPGAVWFDKEWASVQASVDAALPETVNFLQHGGNRWIVTAISDRNPGDVYLLERATMTMRKLLSYEPWIDPRAMAPTRWVRYRARDNLTIPAMLTEPAGSAGKSHPLVLYIHGGPYVEAADWFYDSEVQFLASRGYAVLQPQFRGTDGFGQKLLKAGYRQWGDGMQDDLEDGVQWAVQQGIADPAHVCFYGASYGGYAAVWEAIRNPGLIRCAVSLAGVTSIEYMFDNTHTDYSRVADKSSEMAAEIGDPRTDRERFRRVSPLEHADQVGVPILLAYGVEDRRVPLVHGSRFRAALDRYKKPYEWVLYDHEAHGLSRDENVFDYYNRVDRFLARYLTDGAAPGR